MTLRYDLHLHSCLSPCGENEMTPQSIAGMAAVCELDIIALTDHNTCGNCRAVMEAGAELGVCVVPGMELTTAEEVHVLCLFPDIERAEAFSAMVYDRIMDIKNDAAVFGEQRYMSAQDELISLEPRLLITATDIGVYDVQALCLAAGGVAVPAHINKSSYSILSALGFATPEMGFGAYEITPFCREELITSEHPELAGAVFLKSSDAHCLEVMAGHEAQELELTECSAAALVAHLRALAGK